MAEADPITPSRQIHADIITAVLEDWPQARVSGFMRALRQLPDAEYMADIMKHDPEWVKGINFIPDAWLIDTEKRHVVIFEAINKHDVPGDKFAKMADLSWALDEDYYSLILVRCERFHRRAYDVQSSSLCSELERSWANEPSLGWHVPDWQKYDHAYCAEVFAITTPPEQSPDRGTNGQ
jgi:hypothetical protein